MWAVVFKQTDRIVDRVRTEVHVTLRRRKVAVSGELLNRPRRRASHCEMRTERMPQDAITTLS
jgi:hypothetical protein